MDYFMGGKKIMLQHPRGILICTLFFLAVPLFSTSIKKVEEDYERIVDTWISGEKAYSEILEELDDLLIVLDSLELEKDKYYWQARTYLFYGQVLYYTQEEDNSIEALELSMEWASKALQAGAGADAWRIRAEAGSYLMIQKGVRYIISHSGKVLDDAEQALSLDENNLRASLIVGQGLVNAPPIFGGDKEKGFSQLEQLSQRSGLSQEDRFFLLLALAELYRGEEELEKAETIYLKLEELFPRNSAVRELLSQ